MKCIVKIKQAAKEEVLKYFLESVQCKQTKQGEVLLWYELKSFAKSDIAFAKKQGFNKEATIYNDWYIPL